MTTPLTQKDSRKEQAPRAQDSPESGERSEQKHIWGSDEHCERCGLHLTEVESRKFCKALPRGQQQEWTYEKGHPADIWIICIGGFPKCSVQGESVANLLCDAHNDELAAAVESAVIHPAELITKMAKVEQQLGGERQRTETFEKGFSAAQGVIIEQGKRLLSALAAIEKHNTDHVDDTFCCIDVDLSSLHAHDAKVREPLVEALEQIQSKAKSRITCSRPDICADCTHLEKIRSIASEVLAKVKKQ